MAANVSPKCVSHQQHRSCVQLWLQWCPHGRLDSRHRASSSGPSGSSQSTQLLARSSISACVSCLATNPWPPQTPERRHALVFVSVNALAPHAVAKPRRELQNVPRRPLTKCCPSTTPTRSSSQRCEVQLKRCATYRRRSVDVLELLVTLDKYRLTCHDPRSDLSAGTRPQSA